MERLTPGLAYTTTISSVCFDHHDSTDDQGASNVDNFASPADKIDDCVNQYIMNDDIADHFTISGEGHKVQCEVASAPCSIIIFISNTILSLMSNIP